MCNVGLFDCVSDFDLCRNVTPQSRLDLKLWSCHTLRKELLGTATIDLLDTLRTHDGKSKTIKVHFYLGHCPWIFSRPPSHATIVFYLL